MKMTGQLANDMTGRVGIAGRRSFISHDLTGRLMDRGLSVEFPPKECLGTRDFSCLDCLYLVLGRARPTPEDGSAEVRQLSDLLCNPRKPRRAVYISSMVTTETKARCESMVRGYSETVSDHAPIPITVLRPGAVFGPRQAPDSPMLIPSMAREGERFAPLRPFQPTRFISSGDLADHLVRFSDPGFLDPSRAGEPGSQHDIPGTFTLTPHQVHELYLAFRGLEAGDFWRNEL